MPDQKALYNLKAVIHETGLNAETLRAWERRYGLPKPERTPGGHRMYTLRDIELLKWLVERQQEGMSISRAVELWRSLQDSGQNPLYTGLAGPRRPPQNGTSLDGLRQEWIAACLDFNEPAAEQALRQAFAIAPPETACVQVLQRGLSEIGQIWYGVKASVQQEHFASALAMRHLHALVAAAPPPSRPQRLLAACPSGEDHEFGLLLSAYLLRRHGWDVVYLGANVPLERLEATLASTSPGLVLSLAQTLPAAASLLEMANFLHELNTPLAFGGWVFQQQPSPLTRISGHYVGDELSDIPVAIERIFRNPQEQAPFEPPSPAYQQASRAFFENQAMIELTVAQEMRAVGMAPSHIEQANRFFPQHLSAALSLGDLSLLDPSIEWIAGLLKNAGIPDLALREYLRVYRDCVAGHTGDRGQPILAWFDHYLNEGSSEPA